jgi:hypothetical protein
MQSVPSRGAFSAEIVKPGYLTQDRELWFDCIYDCCILDKKVPGLLAYAGPSDFEAEYALSKNFGVQTRQGCDSIRNIPLPAGGQIPAMKSCVLAMNRRGLDSHLLHQNPQRHAANLGQFEKRCRSIAITILRFASQFEKFLVFRIAQEFPFQTLPQLPVAF